MDGVVASPAGPCGNTSMGQSNGHGAVPVVTVPPLSAKQRDQQRAEMVSQINAVILQVNTLTSTVDSLGIRYRPELGEAWTDADRYLMGHLTQAVEILRGRLDGADRSLDMLRVEFEHTLRRLTRLSDTFDWHNGGRTFWQRVRWIFIGY